MKTINNLNNLFFYAQVAAKYAVCTGRGKEFDIHDAMKAAQTAGFELTNLGSSENAKIHAHEARFITLKRKSGNLEKGTYLVLGKGNMGTKFSRYEGCVVKVELSDEDMDKALEMLDLSLQKFEAYEEFKKENN